MKPIDQARAALGDSAAQFDRITALADEVTLERWRQITAEGFDPEHDDRHTAGELARAAAFHSMAAVAQYAHDDGNTAEADDLYDDAARLWPFDRQAHSTKPARRRLIIAAALILAEIERLDRRAGDQ